MTSPRKPVRTQRGIALLSVIALLIIFLIFAGAVMTQLAQEINSSKTNGVSVKALSAADAGIHAMVLAIEENISLGKPDPTPFTYAYPEPGASPSTTSYSVQIDKNWFPGTAGSRYYLITSEGDVINGAGIQKVQKRTVRALLRSVSLAQYAMFTNYESNQNGKPVWYTPNQYYNGLVYSGGPMHVEYDKTHFDYSMFKPIFGSNVQTVNLPAWLELQGGVPIDDANDWLAVINGGQNAFKTGITPIGLPQPVDNVLVASEAFYGNCCSITSSYPSVPPGVYMNKSDATLGTGPLTTGIYVDGNATITSAVAGSTETFTIKSAQFPTYTVTINFPSGPTTVSQAGNKNLGSFSGVPSGSGGAGVGNGAFFVNGNAIVTLGSVIEGQYTIAVPDYAADQHNISLVGSGSITYNDPTKDMLGLWANNIVLATNSSNITIDASLIAGFPGEGPTNGGFYYNKCNSTCGSANQGTLTLFGGLAENMRGAVGRFFPGSGNHVGFDRLINYDQRLSSNPPPFNPVTGAYDIIAWEDLGN